MTLRKFFKNFAVILAGVLMMAFLGGCGSSEKFAGTWIGTGQYKAAGPGNTCFYTIKIDKNGKGYNIQETLSQWEADKDIRIAFHTDRNDEKMYKNIDYNWKNQQSQPMVATVKDNSLLFTPAGTTTNSAMMTYIEKDGTLQYNTGDATITLHKAKDDKEVQEAMEKYKNEQKDILDKEAEKKADTHSFH